MVKKLNSMKQWIKEDDVSTHFDEGRILYNAGHLKMAI